MLESLFNKIITPSKVFPCEYCETFKNTYFEKHMRMAVSIDSVIFHLKKILQDAQGHSHMSHIREVKAGL